MNYRFRFFWFDGEVLAANHKEIGLKILQLVGWEDNVNSVIHCMTRLRFNLIDHSIADRKKIETVTGVMGTHISGDQFQVIIGNEVSKVYNEIISNSKLSGANSGSKKSSGRNKNVISDLLDVIPSENEEPVNSTHATDEITNREITAEDLLSPVSGEVTPLSELSDPLFSQEIIGKGVAVKPVNGKITSPVKGVVKTLFRTNHAIGITSDNGAKILIHVGIDTVQLEGKYFTAHVEQGQKVTAGQALLDADIEKVKEAGFDTVTSIIITNSANYSAVLPTANNTVTNEDLLLTLNKFN